MPTPFADDLAARRALVSSGLVGISTAVMTKFFKIDLNVSLPVSVAGAIALDFVVNQHQNTHGIDIAKNECGVYLNQLATESSHTMNVWRDHLMFGITTIMALYGTTFMAGRYRALEIHPAVLASRALDRRLLETGDNPLVERVAEFQDRGWGIYGPGDLLADMKDFGEALLENPDALDSIAEDHVRLIMERPGPRLIVPEWDETLDSLYPTFASLPGKPVAGRVSVFEDENGDMVAMIFEGAGSRLIPCLKLHRDSVLELAAQFAS